MRCEQPDDRRHPIAPEVLARHDGANVLLALGALIGAAALVGFVIGFMTATWRLP